MGSMRNPALLLPLLLLLVFFSCFLLFHGAQPLDPRLPLNPRASSASVGGTLSKNETADGKASGNGGQITFVIRRGGGGGGVGGGHGSSEGGSGHGGSSGFGGRGVGALGGHGWSRNAASNSCSCSLAIALATATLGAAILACM